VHGLLEPLLVEELEDEEDELAAEGRHGARAAGSRELDLLCRLAGARASGRGRISEGGELYLGFGRRRRRPSRPVKRERCREMWKKDG
jgi:hypothetical protein